MFSSVPVSCVEAGFVNVQPDYSFCCPFSRADSSAGVRKQGCKSLMQAYCMVGRGLTRLHKDSPVFQL